MKLKKCPLLIQSETNPSCMVEGQSWTRTYFSECIGEKCAAYRGGNSVWCNRFDESVLVVKEDE